jgi:peptidoglycan hydrolase CwlO-like protein
MIAKIGIALVSLVIILIGCSNNSSKTTSVQDRIVKKQSKLEVLECAP